MFSEEICMRFFSHTTTKILAIAIVAVVMGLGASNAFAAQPDMEGALKGLQEAQAHLTRVTQDKAGHANAARKLIADAIEEVQKGIAFGHTQGE
jgi:hypothetical protein